MLNGGMTPWDYYQGSYNNAIQGNEVQMRMQALRNQQIQQQLELQMQMRNSMFQNQHTQAETDLINQGGPGGRVGSSTFANAADGTPLPTNGATSGGATSGGVVPNQDIPPPPQINGQTVPQLPPEDAAPAPDAPTEDAITVNDSAPYPPPDAKSAAISAAIASRLAPTAPPPTAPSQGDTSGLIPGAYPPMGGAPAQSTAMPPPPSIMGVQYDPNQPAHQIKNTDGTPKGTLVFESPVKAKFIDYHTGNAIDVSPYQKPFGFHNTQEMQAAYPGSSIESAKPDPVTGLLVPEKITPGSPLNSIQNANLKDLKDQWGRDMEVQNAQNAAAAYGKFKSAIDLKTGVGDKLAMEALQSLFNPKQAVSVGALKNMQAFGLGKYLDADFVENLIKTGASIPEKDRAAMKQLAEQAVVDGRGVLQAKRASAIQTAQDAGLAQDVAGRALYDPYSTVKGVSGTPQGGTNDDQKAIQWAKSHAGDPRAAQILKLHGL